MQRVQSLLFVLVLALSSCGRIGYDAVSRDAGMDGAPDLSAPDMAEERDDLGVDLGEPVPAIVVTQEPSLTTSETGASAMFSVALATEPASNVTVGVQSGDSTEGRVAPPVLLFTPLNWSSPHIVTVTGVDDADADGSVVYTVNLQPSVSSDPDYNGLTTSAVTITNIDDESAGVTVTPTGGLMTSERGDTATFTVVLNALPSADVTISLTSSDPTEATVDPTSLTFTPTNWNAPQTVTITGVDDSDTDLTILYQIITGDASSADPNYEGLVVVDVSASNSDDDTAGVTVSPTSGLVTTEGGGSASFTLVLNTAPTSDVVIDVVSDDVAEGTVDRATVTFSSLNWSSPQLVTVTGVDDLAADGNQMFHVVLSVAVGSDPQYLGVDPADVLVMNVDNDTAGVTVTPTNGLATSESGTFINFTVVLNATPTTDVTIDLSSDNVGEGVVTPASLTFTTLNWEAPQTVTVTGVDDAVVDGDQVFHIITDMNSGSAVEYASLPVDDVTVTNNDNDSPGITVSPTSGLSTSEAGAFDTFTIVLDSMPAASVTVSLSTDDSSEGQVTPLNVTFTGFNWAAPQTVTVTGRDDAIADGNQPYHVVTATAFSADPEYSGINAADVSVTNVDNDTAGATVTPVTGLTTSETGTFTSFTIVLNSQPSSDVTIALSSDDTTEGYVAPSSVTFTQYNWASPQTLFVYGADDPVADGNQLFHIVTAPAASGDPAFLGLNAADVSVTNTDDDSAGILTSNMTGLVTNESGLSAAFTLVLRTQPTADVTIALSSDRPSEGNATVGSVTFTSSDWATPHLVTIVGANDVIADGNQLYNIITAPAVSADPNYSGIDVANASVTNLDNDSPDFTISLMGSPVTTESAGTFVFSMVLNTMPTANVSVSFTSDDLTEGTVAPASVTFMSGNWNVPQLITVTGVDDALMDGPQTYHVVTSTAVSTDPGYSGRDPANVTLTNYDNDGARYTILPRTGLTSQESFNPAYISVSLAIAPVADVTLTWHTSDATEGDSFIHSLTFTPANWSTSQFIPVYAKMDEIDDGDQLYSIVFDPAVSTDPAFNGTDPGSVQLTSLDIDNAHEIKWREQTLLATTELGVTGSFRVWLKSAPTANVTMTVTSSNTNEGVVSPAMLTFTPLNWATPQIVTVTGVADAMADGNVAYDVTLGAITSSDVTYNGYPDIVVPFTNCEGTGNAFDACTLDQTSYARVSGAQRVTLPDNAGMDIGTGDFTIEVWARIAPVQLNRFATLYAKRPNASSGFLLCVCTYNCGSTMLFQAQGANGNFLNYSALDNVWRHYAMVRSSGTVSMYVNSSLIWSNPLAGSISSVGTPVQLGFDSANAGQTGLDGGVHNFRIFRTVRTPAEIRSDMWSVVSMGGGIAAAWSVNDGSGQTVGATVGSAGFLGSAAGADGADAVWTALP